jgi:hypothetical protein
LVAAQAGAVKGVDARSVHWGSVDIHADVADGIANTNTVAAVGR